MDIRQLRYFITVVQEGQITLAAKKLNMAQPPLSQQLKNMETEIGAKLLSRNGRKLELTEAGHLLYQKGLHLLDRFDETITAVKETGEGLSGTLSIGCVMSCIHYLPERIRAFNDTYPQVKVKILAGDPYRLTDYIYERSIEAAIVRSPLNTENFNTIELDIDPFVFIAPKAWEQLPSGSKIAMRDISELPLIALHRVNGVGVYEVVLEEFNRHGLEPNYVCESPDATILLSMVKAGIGGVLLPKSVLFNFSKENLRVFEIIDSSAETTTSIIWQKERYLSKAAKRFIELFTDEYPST
ncbi:LysR family transcriptional regulator [Halalkalibacter okhensis]|uniref:LysR family transcriptional regulator n=1 Tax=Halalkalibacter okhensis TaxID=333138 RepID=A0A0B0IFQ9_9BACI|nr:LysR family transcriptional regulator [Halalkalibacter okhensis]KHF40155.1 LysR family transcriptional regulator [Halalkalibacter okhensis]